MADTAPGSYFIDTASGPMEIATGLPDWVNADLVAEANATLAPAAPPEAPASGVVEPNTDTAQNRDVAPTTQGTWIETPNGPVYAAPGVPDWVIRDQIAQLNPQLSQQTTDRPAPVALPAPTRDNPNPRGAPPAGNQPGGLGAAAATIIGAGQAIAGKVADAARAAGADISSIAGSLTDAVRRIIDSVLPTVQEMAMSLTSRFGDLAHSLMGKVVEVTEYAETMALHSASAFSALFDDAWSWLAGAIVALFGGMVGHLAEELAGILGTLPEAAL